MSAIRKVNRQKTLDDLEPVLEPEGKEKVLQKLPEIDGYRKGYLAPLDLYIILNELQQLQHR